MSKKIPHILLFLSVAAMSYGQLMFNGWSHNYLNVYSYNGAVAADGFTMGFTYIGTNLNIPGWKLSVRIIEPFTAGNKAFPLKRLSLVPVYTEGRANNPGPLPTVQQIGMISPVILSDDNEVFLVPSSNAPLYNVSQWNSYYNLRMVFDFVVAGGGYLNSLRNKIFNGVLRFTAYRSDNSVIGYQDVFFIIHVHRLSGTLPPENEYSIRVSAEASNGLLELNSMDDYIHGKNVTYSDGLLVTATTDYQISVRSTDANFSSLEGSSLPLDVVKLHLSGSAGTSVPATLSTESKTIFRGVSTGNETATFNIIYSTQPNDYRLYDASSNLYGTSLIYEITPQ
ncbi:MULTISPECIES: hypothetical protein [Proteiniphilum]|jgi:hypothetical protein|uniref:hypothetical protein n=1 Tax=Proteiniphilum TaxID=294702 RepID=UPI001EEBAFFB|nr:MULTISPECIES: hypothetical protein [Proteiniphilum]ULB35076.1 hypothetical protein KDN43_03240 [Proteiniphilum propionicum]